jgi:hypothetical protein
MSNELTARWSRLKAVVADTLATPEDRLAHLKLLDGLEHDQPYDDKEAHLLMLGFKRAPAAKRNHHACEGGLVIHLLEMWDLWVGMRHSIIPTVGDHVTDDRVLKAILYHDLHKAYRTFVLMPGEVWKVEYAYQDWSERLVTHEIKSLFLLMQAGIAPDLLQLNAFLLAEGGYAKIKPSATSVLAKVVYLLDELSGNVRSRVMDGTLLDIPWRGRGSTS